ncbi:MAG TPA: hypothetical protein VK326_09920 [Solirubrobacterales bacterium]|nr:hypothetical protein [Solirubrobacterales bacterium]
MAEAVTNIVLTAGKRIESAEPADAIMSQLSGASRGDVSFIHVSDTRGRKHWVNVHEIVQIHEEQEPAASEDPEASA